MNTEGLRKDALYCITVNILIIAFIVVLYASGVNVSSWFSFLWK